MADLSVRSQVRKAKMSPLTSLAFRTLVQQRAKQSGGLGRERSNPITTFLNR